MDYSALENLFSEIDDLTTKKISNLELSFVSVQVLFNLKGPNGSDLDFSSFKVSTVILEIHNDQVCFQYNTTKVICLLKKECTFIKSQDIVNDIINRTCSDDHAKLIWMQLRKMFANSTTEICSISLFPRCIPHYNDILLQKVSGKWTLISTISNSTVDIAIPDGSDKDYSYLESITMLESNKKHSPFHVIHPYYHCHLADTLTNQMGKLETCTTWSSDQIEAVFNEKSIDCVKIDKIDFSSLMAGNSSIVFKKVIIFDIKDYYNKIYIHVIGHLSHGSNYALKYKSVGKPDQNSMLYHHIEYAIKCCQGQVTVGVPLGSELIDKIAEFILIRIEHILHINLKDYDYSMSRISDKFIFLCKTDDASEIEDEFNKLLAKMQLSQNNLKRKEYGQLNEIPFSQLLKASTMEEKLQIFDRFQGKELFEREAVMHLTQEWFSLPDSTSLALKKKYLTRLLSHQIARPLFLAYKDMSTDYSKELKFALELELDYSVPSIQLCWLLFYAEKFNWKLHREDKIKKLNYNFMVAIFWMRYAKLVKMPFAGTLVWEQSVYESILKVYGLEMDFGLTRNDSVIGVGFDF